MPLTVFYPLSGFALTLFAGIIAWAFRLEGRVNTQERLQEQKHSDLKEFITTLMEVKFSSVNQRLDRIERNGNGHAVKE
jgi:hypothetical protein